MGTFKSLNKKQKQKEKTYLNIFISKQNLKKKAYIFVYTFSNNKQQTTKSIKEIQKIKNRSQGARRSLSSQFSSMFRSVN